MGLFFAEQAQKGDVRDAQKLKLLHRMQCNACPLQREPGRMPATGAERPVIYCIGEAPGKTEIEEREQFVGESGQLLRPRIPDRFLPLIRWNNTVRSRPPRNRTPERVEIECCRPSVVADIEASRPKVIFGFGNVPLNWVCGFSGITVWRGRRMPVKIGKHVCWYYPMLHPSFILRGRREDDRREGADFIGSEDERMFVFDLERALQDVSDGLPTPVVHDEAKVREGVEIITECTEAALRKIEVFLAGAAKADVVGLDYETDRLRPYDPASRILTAAVSVGDKTLAFPFDHRDATWTMLLRRGLQDVWCRFLHHCKARKIAHNLAFEMEWTAVKFGPQYLRMGRWEDTAVQANVLDERTGKMKPGPFALEFLVQQYFGFNLKKLANVDRNRLGREPLEKVLRYNGPDAKYALLLWREQDRILSEEHLDDVYDLSLRRVPTCILMQVRGVPVNQDAVKVLHDKYAKRLKKIESDIAKLPIAGKFHQQKRQDFNPYSNKDVLYVFSDMLKCQECRIYDKKKREERLSVDESVLEQIDHPLARLIIDLRKANKSMSTYIEPLRKDSDVTVVHPDGLIHPQFNTYFPETGRLSCEDPNLQNWPKRDDEAKELRRPIEASNVYSILSFDYGQIEARVIAMFTKDKAFCKALWDRYDVHGGWAQRIAKSYPKRIGGAKMLNDKKAMKDFRTDIKNQWTFPLFFGARLESAAGYLNIPVDELRPHYDAFWEQFYGVKDWQEQELKFYHKYGYVECLTGRRRHGPLSLNKVFNTPVQGTAADIVCDAMCRLSESGDPDLQLEIQIHDDLTFLRVETKRLEEVAEKVINVLLDVPFGWVNVPITIEMSVGKNWQPYDKVENPDGMQEFGTFSSDTWFK